MALNNSISLRSNETADFGYWIGIFFLSFSFSWLSQLLVFVIFKNNFIEFFLFLGFYFLIKSKTRIGYVLEESLFSNHFKGSFLFILIFAILGLILSDFSFPEVYADFRSNLTFAFVLIFLLSKNWLLKERESFIIHILVFISVMDLITLQVREPLGQIFTKQSISVVAPAILSIYYIKKRRLLYALVFVSIMSYDAIVAFYRNYYLIVIVLFLLVIIATGKDALNTKLSVKVKIRSILFLGILLLAGIYFSGTVYKYWMSDGSKMIHSINRTKELISGEDEEVERMNSVKVIVNFPERFIVPQGIGWRAFQKEVQRNFKDVHILSTMDSCIFYLAYHYGLVILIIFLYFFCKVIVNIFSGDLHPIYLDKVTRFGFLAIFLASFFSQGVILAVLQSSFCYGILLALIVKPF